MYIHLISFSNYNYKFSFIICPVSLALVLFPACRGRDNSRKIKTSAHAALSNFSTFFFSLRPRESFGFLFVLQPIPLTTPSRDIPEYLLRAARRRSRRCEAERGNLYERATLLPVARQNFPLADVAAVVLMRARTLSTQRRARGS